MDFHVSLYGYTPAEVEQLRTALNAALFEGDTAVVSSHKCHVRSCSITYEPGENARVRALKYYQILGNQNRSAPGLES